MRYLERKLLRRVAYLLAWTLSSFLFLACNKAHATYVDCNHPDWGTAQCVDYDESTAFPVGFSHQSCPGGAYYYEGGQGYSATTYIGTCDSLGYQNEPETCSDGQATAGEDGIDCGGDCSAACVELCPPGWGYLSGRCYSDPVPMDEFGNCPAGTTIWNHTDSECTMSVPSTTANPDYATENLAENYGWSDGPTVEYTSDTTSTTVDNQDGTSTTTTTTTSSGTSSGGASGGSSSTGSSTTTTTTIYNTATGQPVGSSTTTTTEQPPTEDPGNYDWTIPEGEFDGEIDESILPDEPDLINLFGSGGNSPIGVIDDVFDNTGIQTSEQVCSLSTTIFNQVITLDFCSQERKDPFIAAGVILVSLSYLSSIFIIFGKGD